MIYGKEVGESGTPHLQGYVEYKNPRDMTAVKKMLGSRVHLEKAMGTAKQASDYCKKEGKYTERGTMSVGAGHRSDLDTLGMRVLSGEKPEKIAEDNPGAYIKYHRGLQALANTLPSPKWRDVKVLVYYGPTGSGKTRTAMSLEHGDVFKMNTNTNGTLWFDGYRGERVLLLDDYYGWIKHGELLTLLDGYPYRCQLKGSFTWAQWTTVVITSNKPPQEWYAQGLNPALARRLTQVRKFDTPPCQEIMPYFKANLLPTFQWHGTEVGTGVGGNTRHLGVTPTLDLVVKLMKALRRVEVVENSYYGQCGVERDGLQKEVTLLVDDDLEVEDNTLVVNVANSAAECNSTGSNSASLSTEDKRVDGVRSDVCNSTSITVVKGDLNRSLDVDVHHLRTLCLSRSREHPGLVVQDPEAIAIL